MLCRDQCSGKARQACTRNLRRGAAFTPPALLTSGRPPTSPHRTEAPPGPRARCRPPPPRAPRSCARRRCARQCGYYLSSGYCTDQARRHACEKTSGKRAIKAVGVFMRSAAARGSSGGGVHKCKAVGRPAEEAGGGAVCGGEGVSSSKSYAMGVEGRRRRRAELLFMLGQRRASVWISTGAHAGWFGRGWGWDLMRGARGVQGTGAGRGDM